MDIRDRIIRLDRILGRALLANPKNWKKHPKQQRAAMRALLDKIGFVGALLAKETDELCPGCEGSGRADGVVGTDGVLLGPGADEEAVCRWCAGHGRQLLLLDGHMRSEIAPEAMVPVLVTDLDEEEAVLVLATFDPIAAFGQASAAAVDAIVAAVSVESAAVNQVIAEWAAGAGVATAEGARQPRRDMRDLPRALHVKIIIEAPSVAVVEEALQLAAVRGGLTRGEALNAICDAYIKANAG
jgi:hypothetical protein